MLQIKGIYISNPIIDIIYTLKSQLLVNNINRFSDIEESGYNLKVSCPFHASKRTGEIGQEKHASMGILLRDRGKIKTGTVNCFSCGYHSNFQEFISNCFGKDDKGKYGEEWLLNNFTALVYEERNLEIPDISREVIKKETQQEYITEEELESYRYYHPYMYHRKLTDEIIHMFDVGFQKDYEVAEGFYSDVLTFPIWDLNGNVIFIARRSIRGKNFYLPEREKPVYALNFITNDMKEVVVCESIFNTLTLWSWGIPSVALLGGFGSDKQYELLKLSHIRKFKLAFDGDYAGSKALYKFKKHLGSSKLITMVQLPNKKDVNDLTYDEYNNLREYY